MCSFYQNNVQSVQVMWRVHYLANTKKIIYCMYMWPSMRKPCLRMYTKYTSLHYFNYLTFCVRYTNSIGFPIVSSTISKSFIDTLRMFRQKSKSKSCWISCAHKHCMPAHICDQAGLHRSTICIACECKNVNFLFLLLIIAYKLFVLTYFVHTCIYIYIYIYIYTPDLWKGA